MRVLHVGKFFPPHRGGMESHLELLSAHLRKSITVDVLVANDTDLTERSVIDGMAVTRAGTMLKFASTSFCPAMLRAVKKTNADVIHLHLPNPAAILVYLASGHTGPLVVTYHSDTERHKLLAAAFRPFLLHALDRCAAIIVSSAAFLESSPTLPRYQSRCRVVPFGVSATEFDRCDPCRVQAIRTEYGNRIVLAVGRLVPYKGFKYLIRAMQQIQGRLLIVGQGALHDDLKNEATACGVGERVTILSGVCDLAPYYHAADVFVLPSVSRTEAFGIVQLEAMACGKPVVNTAIATGVPWVSPRNVTGLTVPPGNSGALAEAVTRLLDDAALRSRYGEAARRRVEQEFSVERMTERVLQVYREALERSPARGRVEHLLREQRRKVISTS